MCSALSLLHAKPGFSDDGRSAVLDLGTDIPPIHWRVLSDLEPSGITFDTSQPANFALLAALPFALATGRDLHIAGELCPRLLGHAENIVQYRSLWNPTEARPITLSADSVQWRGDYDINGPHIAAVSGGVDSTQMLANNFHNASAANARNITTGLIVRGFDYPSGASEGFTRMATKTGKICRSLAAQPLLIETDWRNAARALNVSWETYHILALASVFHLLSGRFAGGIFAADYNYRQDKGVLHWGSNSISNAMLSAGSFTLEARGADRGRSQKIRQIYEYGMMAEVGVCWAGPRSGENCGKCEKCLRTMFATYGQDLDPKIAFPRDPVLADMFRFNIGTSGRHAFYKDILANWKTTRSPLMKAALSTRLALQPIEAALYRPARKLREFARKR